MASSLMLPDVAPSLNPEAVVTSSTHTVVGTNNTATRHLCAGAYLDSQFCLGALREVYYQPKRLAAPSFGFDPTVVLGHCLRARRATVIRDVLLIGLLLAAALTCYIAVPVALLALAALHVATVAVQAGRDGVRYLRDTPVERIIADAEAGQTALRRQTPRRQRAEARLWSRGYRRVWLENLFTQIVARAIGIVVTYGAYLAVLTLLAFLAWRWTPLQHGRLAMSVNAVPVFVLLTLLVPAGFRAWNRRQLSRFTPESNPSSPVTRDRLVEIQRQSVGNTMVYSGHRPFVGSGNVLRRWHIAQRLVRPNPEDPFGKLTGEARKVTEKAREFPQPPFTAKDISDYVRDYIAALADEDQVPEWRVPNLDVSERILVAGTEIEDLVLHTEPHRVAEILRHPTDPQRHFLACQVVSWGGELVTTVYVHFAVQGKALYVELDVTALMPCDDRFRVVDEVGGTGFGHVLRAGAAEFVVAPTILAKAPAALVRSLADHVSLRTARRRGTKVKRGYDYGAVVGVRELASSASARDPMQSQDIQKYSRVIERRVLAAILDFLEDRDVDVTEYRATAANIISAGAVAGAGGTVTVEGNAIGVQSNVSTGTSPSQGVNS